MQLTHDFRDSALVKGITDDIRVQVMRSTRLMEFCGSHTAAILKYGLRQLVPEEIDMLSGPGCPVCVTSQLDIDRAIALTKIPGMILCTFGDMLKVPGSYGSLAEARAGGSDVRIVYSTLDALQIARANPSRSVVFLGVGFETTAPTIAASILQACKENITNYSVFSLAKACPPVMKALLDGGEIKIDGIICPGHVSSIIGTRPFEFIPREYGIACVIAGFEPLDILVAVDMLLKQIKQARPAIEIAYSRGVSAEGNQIAQKLMTDVFQTTNADWRGVGAVSASGLSISPRYASFDASLLYKREPGPALTQPGCRCGDILRGAIKPTQCHLFRNTCTPENPVGPCMVSGEGACSSYYLFGETDAR